MSAALRTLADVGYAGLTVGQLQARAGAAGKLLEGGDLEDVVVIALQRVRLYSAPPSTGSLRGDLCALVRPWLGFRSPDERAVAAVLSAAEWNPRLKAAVADAFDRPLAEAVGTLLARSVEYGAVPASRVQTLNWILRSLALSRLRAIHPRTHVDLDELVDHLIVGLGPAGVRA